MTRPRRSLGVGIAWLIAVVFIASASSKIASRPSESPIGSLVPPLSSPALSAGIIFAELVLAAGLIFAQGKIPWLGLCGTGFVLMSVVVIWATPPGEDVPACGCFGSAVTLPLGRHLILNGILIAVAGSGLLLLRSDDTKEAGRHDSERREASE